MACATAVSDPPAAEGATAANRRLFYIADPMCSWCWGFAPVIARIDAEFGASAPLRLIAGGLRIGTTEPMSPRDKAYVRHHWEQVHATTGQPFDFTFFDRQGFVYDTLPACRAVVTARNLAPDAALRIFAAVQRAFYAENRDVTCIEVLGDVAVAAGLDRDAFLAVYASAEIGDSLAADFAAVQAMQVSGFPALVMMDGNGGTFLTVGYRPFDALQPMLEHWLEDAGGP